MVRPAVLALFGAVLMCAAPVSGQTTGGPTPAQPAAAPSSATPASPASAAGAAATAVPARAAVPPAVTGPRRPRSYEQCTREAFNRKYRGAERRHFVFRCQLGYGRRLFRRRGPTQT